MLTELGQRYGTDKAAFGYLPIYERYLQGREIRSVLEIGVYGGSSLRMWSDFFPQAEIFGLDIDPGCLEHAADRIHVRIGSQDDPAVIASLVEQAGGFDLVVDDGSHVNNLTLASWQMLWPVTRQLYVIEDLGNSYMDLTPHIASWPGMHHNKPMSYVNERRVMDVFFSQAIHSVDSAEYALHFHKWMAVFER